MRVLSVLLLFAFTARVDAQGGMTASDTAITPAGWTWRTDQPATPQRGGSGRVGLERFEFRPMAPGWHVTMGPGALLFPQHQHLTGRYRLSAEMILFPDAAAEAPYGVFVGGSALEGADAAWTAFVVRATGEASVMRVVGGRTELLRPWAAHPAVAARDSTGWARNTVAVHAEPDSLRFVVNGSVVQSWSRGDLVVDGQFGFRIGARANLHITNLDLTQRLAPFPPPRN